MDCLFCVKRCFGIGMGSANYSFVKEQILPKVILDTSTMGNDVVVVKNGHRICGSGCAITNVPILQNKAYFEVKVQQTGIWGVGLSSSSSNLNCVPLGCDSHSWVLRHDGRIMHDNKEIYKLTDDLQESDIIAVTFDHIELKFIVNNKPNEFSVSNIKGPELYPVLYVDDGAILDASFTSFQYEPPLGYDRILVEKSLL